MTSTIVILRVGETIVGGTLLYSGVIHSSNPFHLASAIAAYGLVPTVSIPVLSTLLPYLQITIGYCLIVGVALQSARTIGSVMFFGFVAVQAIAIATGKSISCGCFGFSTEPLSLKTLCVPLLCFVVCTTSQIISGARSRDT